MIAAEMPACRPMAIAPLATTSHGPTGETPEGRAREMACRNRPRFTTVMPSRCIVLGLLFAFLPAALAFDGAPRYDRWEVIGPGGGGGIFLPTISPHDANLLLVSCDMTGAYISHDGGTVHVVGFGLATENRQAIVCMSHFCPLESQSEKHKS